MNLRGKVFDRNGNPVQGAVVEAIDPVSQTVVGSTTSLSDGSWVLEDLPNQELRVKITFGGAVRWLDPRTRLQVEAVVGLDGVSAPLPDNSVRVNQLEAEIGFPKTLVVNGTEVVWGKNDRFELEVVGIRTSFDGETKKVALEFDRTELLRLAYLTRSAALR